MEKGDLKQNGVHLLEHEWNTVKFLLEKGYKGNRESFYIIKTNNTHKNYYKR